MQFVQLFLSKKGKCKTHSCQLFSVFMRDFLIKNKIKIKSNKNTQDFPELRFYCSSIHHRVKLEYQGSKAA